MLRRNLSKISWCKLRKQALHKSSCLRKSNVEQSELTKVRNIGILAHIDAGKTTTTERMLYYSGTISSMGEVHHGNTVTDYMEQERQRGITITSAAVTFNWKDYKFNLIDTPGHIDFTMEVEQTLSVLDGAVVVLDGSAGVEAQTSTVWRQADRHDLPRMVFVNKMDRQDSDLEMCLNSIESKLGTTALPTQFPVRDSDGLSGIIDVLTLEKLSFDRKDRGVRIEKTKLLENESGKLWEQAIERRRSLTDKLSGLDDKLANIIIEQESLDEIPAQALADSLRRSTLDRKGVPVLLGSAYKNIGVQPLMDGIILYLPSPEANLKAGRYLCFQDNLAARAFKVVHDKQRGPVTFMRVYSGKLTKGQRLYNIQQEKTEHGGRLYVAYADDYEETPAVERGNIAGVTGLKWTVTGDLVTTSASAAGQARKLMEKQKTTTAKEVASLFSVGVRVPDPVFFCSIEPPSLAHQKDLDNALAELQREDPSLRVTQDQETGQTVLAGMGELHLDIIKDRIRAQYKIDAELGALQIAYKETLLKEAKDTHVTQHKIGTTNHSVTVTLSLIPEFEGSDALLLDKSHDSAANVTGIHPRVMSAVKQGVSTALSSGPRLGCPVVNVGVMLHWLEVGRGTSDTMVGAAVTQCIQKLLQAGGSILLEPIMHLEVVTSEDSFSTVLADLSRRRAQIRNITTRGPNKVLEALTPLSELLGYSTALRTITSGTASFSLEFNSYEKMGPIDEQQAIKRVTGF